MKKRIIALSIAIAMSISVVACGSDASSSEKSTEVQETTEIINDEAQEDAEIASESSEVVVKDEENIEQADVSYADELISETWYDVSAIRSKDTIGGRLYFNEDGSGRFKNRGILLELQWAIDNDTLILNYEENGEAVEAKFQIGKNDGKLGLNDENGNQIYVKESDAKKKISQTSVGAEVELGMYEQDNIDNGTEPIRWIVADNYSISGYVMLVSNYGLDVQPYNTNNNSVTWETCSLRKWLNEDFYNTAFSEEEKAIISPINVHNPPSSKYKTDGGNTTLDTVWIWGEYDAKDHMSLVEEHDGKVMTTDYVQGLGKKLIESYWLRSPSEETNVGHSAQVARDDSNIGEVFSDITSPHVVRPVILVPKDAEVFISYENKPIKISTPTKERPSIGMTAAEVKKSSWGYPEKINTTETEYGTREQWVYSDNRYIYLEDGIVTAIQDSK